MKAKKASAPDRLSLLRSKYASQLRTKKAEVAAIEQKIALIDELETESSALREDSVLPSRGQYSEMRLTDAALAAVEESGGRTSIAAVKNHLLNGGYVPKGKNFSITLAKTLQRLHTQRKLETDKKDGKRRYWKPDPIRLLVAK